MQQRAPEWETLRPNMSTKMQPATAGAASSAPTKTRAQPFEAQGKQAAPLQKRGCAALSAPSTGDRLHA